MRRMINRVQIKKVLLLQDREFESDLWDNGVSLSTIYMIWNTE